MASALQNKSLAQWRANWDAMSDEQRQQCVDQALKERTPEEVAKDQAEFKEAVGFMQHVKERVTNEQWQQYLSLCDRYAAGTDAEDGLTHEAFLGQVKVNLLDYPDLLQTYFTRWVPK